MSGSDIRRVVTVVDVEIEAHAGGLAARLSDSHAFQRGDLYFSAMDREVHCGDGGNHGDRDEQHDDTGHAEKANERACLSLSRLSVGIDDLVVDRG